MDAQQRDLYDRLTTGVRATGPQHVRLTADDGSLDGPFDAFLRQPAVGRRLQALGAAIRFETGLSPRCRELAILVVAAAWRSEFEWYAHARIGRAAGLTDGELAAVRDGAGGPHAEVPGAWPDPVEAMVVRAARALVAAGDLDDALYGEALEALGETHLFELVALVGYYAALALQLRVFRVPAPDGDPFA